MKRITLTFRHGHSETFEFDSFDVQRSSITQEIMSMRWEAANPTKVPAYVRLSDVILITEEAI